MRSHRAVICCASLASVESFGSLRSRNVGCRIPRCRIPRCRCDGRSSLPFAFNHDDVAEGVFGDEVSALTVRVVSAIIARPATIAWDAQAAQKKEKETHDGQDCVHESVRIKIDLNA